MVAGAVDLVLVDGEPDYVRARHGCDGPQRASDATAHVQRLLAWLQAQDGGNAGLVRRLASFPVLAGKLGREVERLRKARSGVG